MAASIAGPWPIPKTHRRRIRPMSIIETGTQAPAFELDSHSGDKVSSSSFTGSKNMLLVFYPLDFTPT